LRNALKVVVTGASGFIGRQFLTAFQDYDVTGLCFSHPRPGLVAVDLRDADAVRSTLDNLQPNVIIHCAARPSADWCELNPQEARALNFAPTELLAKESARLGATIVFLSTDYIFDGTSGPYCEMDMPNPINVYGRLKLEGEQAIRAITPNHIIVRTTNVYGFDPESKNFLMAILPQIERGKHLNVAMDQCGNPTLVSDLCYVIRELVLKRATGTFHVTGPDLVSRLEWLEAAVRIFGLYYDLVSGVPTSELDQPAPRPKKSGLVSSRLQSFITRPPVGMEEGLTIMKRQWDEYHSGVSATESVNSYGA